MAVLHVDRGSRISAAVLLGTAALVMGVVAVWAQTATTPAKPRVARDLTVNPAVRELRVGVARASATAGQVLVDTRKLAPAGTDASRSVVATDLAGRPVAMEWVDGATVSVKPTSNQWVVVRPENVAPQSMKRGVQWLPGVCVPPVSNPGAVPDVLASYADFATVPVVWDPERDAYRVFGNIGVARNGDLATGGPIGRTATVKMSYIGVSAAATDELAITDLGLDGERPFTSVFPRTDVPGPTLVVRSNLGAEQPYLLDVRPRVELTPRRNPILGLGLEEIVVVLECVQAHGAPLVLGTPSTVTLACTSGRDDGADGMAVSSANPQAQFRFRSTWLGPARIVATARTEAGAIVGSVVVHQTLPFPQLAAALVGGALGGYARRFVRGARRRGSGRRVVEGLVVGLVAFVAGVLGVGFLNLPTAIVGTAAGAFLTGVIAGFAGVVVLERLSSRVASAPKETLAAGAGRGRSID